MKQIFDVNHVGCLTKDELILENALDSAVKQTSVPRFKVKCGGRKKQYVQARYLVAKQAASKGVEEVDIARFLGIERTTVIHYLKHYVEPNKLDYSS